MIKELLEHCRILAASIEVLEAEIVAHARQDEAARRLATIPGVGPITASLMAATVADIGLFKSARQFAAWLGLVPRQYSTAGKPGLVGSPRPATEPANRWSWAPPDGLSGCGVEQCRRGLTRAIWSAAPSGWSRWRWRTRWRASPGR